MPVSGFINEGKSPYKEPNSNELTTMWDYLLYDDNFPEPEPCAEPEPESLYQSICQYAYCNDIKNYSPNNYLTSTNVDFEIEINEFTILYKIEKEISSSYPLLGSLAVEKTTIELLSSITEAEPEAEPCPEPEAEPEAEPQSIIKYDSTVSQLSFTIKSNSENTLPNKQDLTCCDNIKIHVHIKESCLREYITCPYNENCPEPEPEAESESEPCSQLESSELYIHESQADFSQYKSKSDDWFKIITDSKKICSIQKNGNLKILFEFEMNPIEFTEDKNINDLLQALEFWVNINNTTIKIPANLIANTTQISESTTEITTSPDPRFNISTKKIYSISNTTCKLSEIASLSLNICKNEPEPEPESESEIQNKLTATNFLLYKENDCSKQNTFIVRRNSSTNKIYCCPWYNGNSDYNGKYSGNICVPKVEEQKRWFTYMYMYYESSDVDNQTKQCNVNKFSRGMRKNK